MKEKITLLPFGTTVEFGDSRQSDFIGKIEAARVSRYTILYEIRYWKMDSQCTILLEQKDFSVLDQGKEKSIVVGFSLKEDLNE